MCLLGILSNRYKVSQLFALLCDQGVLVLCCNGVGLLIALCRKRVGAA